MPIPYSGESPGSTVTIAGVLPTDTISGPGSPFSGAVISDTATTTGDQETVFIFLRDDNGNLTDQFGTLSGSSANANASVVHTGLGIYELVGPMSAANPFSPQRATQLLDTITFTPSVISGTVTATIEVVSANGQNWAGDTIKITAGPPATPAPAVLDTTVNQPLTATAQPYTGPVTGLQEQYINITSDSLNIGVSTPNWFIHSGSGTDAIAVNSGTNVLDGGTGSNFLTGGSGSDTFFVDDRGPTADIWSTVSGFHAGDAATIWGITPQDFGLAWVDGQGAAGFTGLTLHATASGQPTASLTLAGYTSADLSDGRLSVSFGTDPASGSAYMYVHGNS